MRATVLTKVFAEGLKRAMMLKQQATRKEAVELKTINGKLEIHRGNCGSFIQVATNGEAEDLNTTIKSVVKLQRALKHFDQSDHIELEFEGDSLKLSQGKRSISVATIDGGFEESESFSLSNVATVKSYDYDQAKLLTRLKSVIYAKAVDETRPILTGVCFRDGDIAALDGYRLALSTDNGISIDGTYVAESEALNVLTKTLSKKEGGLTISTADYKGDNVLIFEYDNIKLISRCLLGKFLNYNDLFRESQTFATVDSGDMLKDVKFLSESTNSKNVLLMKVGSDSIKMEAKDENTTSESELKATVEGVEMLIGYNAKYMAEALNIISKENKVDQITMEMTTPVNPITIQYETAVGVDKHLLLPIKLKD